MVRSQTLTVTGETPTPPALIGTELTIGVSPPSGTVPFNVTVSGRLIRLDTYNPVGGKTIRIYLDGVLVATVTTSTSPDISVFGTYSASVSIKTAGSHSIYAEFPGDATFAGCGYEEPVEEAFQAMVRLG